MEPIHYPIETRVRDGREVKIRPIEPGDFQAMLDFFRGLRENDRRYLRNDVTDPAAVQRYVTNADNTWLVGLLAEASGQVVGTGSLEPEHHRWTAHVGEIRLVVATDWQRHGLGTVLSDLLVRHAMALGLEKVMARVVDGQHGAELALTRLGFVREAVLRRHVQDITGRRRDLIIYSNDVSHVWERLEQMVADFSPMRLD